MMIHLTTREHDAMTTDLAALSASATGPFDWAGLAIGAHITRSQKGDPAAAAYLRARIEAAFVPRDVHDDARVKCAAAEGQLAAVSAMLEVERDMGTRYIRRSDEATARAEAAEAQNAKLREALSEAIVWNGYDDDGVSAVWLDQARAALGEDHDK